jgi:peptide/nickel transport system substrate-binding protein
MSNVYDKHTASLATSLETPVSRRKLTGIGAGVTAAILSGASLPGGFGKVVMAQDGGTEFHAAWPYLDPGAGGHFNHFVANGILNPPNLYGDLMYIPMGMLYWANNEWLPLLATEWSFIESGSASSPVASPAADGATPAVNVNADTLVVTLREGVMWSDDQPFTARDVVDTFDCLWLMSNTVWEYIDTVEALDDYTVSFHMAKPSTVVERYVIRRSPLPSAIFGEWAQKARDLRGSGKTIDDPEGKQLLDQFSKFRPDQVIVNGPYTIDIDSITNAQFDMPKNEKSFFADVAKFDKIVNFNGETDTISAVVLSKDIDYATHGFPPATEQQMIETGIRVLRPPIYSGDALLFNFAAHPEFLDKRVRQAFATAIDRVQVGQVALAESGVGVQYMTGISDNLTRQWLTEEAIATLNQYPYDQAVATTLLQDAGWSKDGDRWKKPDGSDASYELLFPAEHANKSAAAANIAEQMTAFGFDIVAQPITYTQIGTDVDQGKFQLALQGWGSSENPHPHYSYATAFFVHNTLAKNAGGDGMAFPLVQQTDVAGEVDLEALTVASAEGMDVDLQKDQVTTIAQVFNELLNIIPIYERFGNNAALEGVRVVAWPADDDPLLKNSPYADGIPTMLILTGGLDPVPQ